MNIKQADLLIIDGRHMLYRTADVFKSLSAKVGDEEVGTGGVYGFLNVVLKIHRRYGGTVNVAWEGTSNFRYGLYPDYKKKGAIDDDMIEFLNDMAEQEKRLKVMLRAMGVKQYKGVDCEADDVIGVLSHRASQNNKKVLIYSGDSDLRQLINANCNTVSPATRGGSDTIYGWSDVIQKHGVGPNFIADLKALSGDSSDNVPGIRGIGEVTAAKLIRQYGNVEKVISNAYKDHTNWPVSERFRQPILDEKNNIRLFKKLTTIRIDADIKLIKPKRDQSQVVKFFKIHKFVSLLAAAELNGLMRMSNEKK